MRTCFFCDGTPHTTYYQCKVLHRTLHVSILCQSDMCVGLRQFWAANLAAAAAAVAFAVGAVADANTRPAMWICRKWYAVPPQYPHNADGQLRNDQEFCTKLQGELKKTVFGMCTINPIEASKPSHTDTKADLIFKRVFCNYLCK